MIFDSLSPEPPVPRLPQTSEADRQTNSDLERPNHLIRQLALQFAACLLIVSLAWPYFGLLNEPLPWPQTAIAIGIAAFLLARTTHQPIWWQIIHSGFATAAWAMSLLEIAPGWYLTAFLALLLVFRGAAAGQIPLYLSNADTTRALAEILASERATSFVDIGAGIGSTITPLARLYPQVVFTGIENAPASWLIGRLRSRRQSNVTWRLSDLWKTSLQGYDIVYAFLSPAPMADLWEKVAHEMPPGSLFISNSFPFPDVEATEVLELDDARRTRLYCYRLAKSA